MVMDICGFVMAVHSYGLIMAEFKYGLTMVEHTHGLLNGQTLVSACNA